MDSARLPIEYLKIQSFNIRYDACLKYQYAYINNTLNDNDFETLFYSIKSLFNFYWKYIEYQYKKTLTSAVFPKDILQMAKSDNIISDADCWLNYIEDFNIFFLEKDKDKKYISMHNIVDKYYPKIDSMLILMRSPDKVQYMQKYKKEEDAIMKEPFLLDDSEPVYSPDVLGISELSYNKLIDCFRSNTNIRTVWAHGSRIYNTNLSGSDIDLIFDCPAEAWQSVVNDIHWLSIPYFIDCKNIYIEKHIKYIKSIMYLGTKIIYKR